MGFAAGIRWHVVALLALISALALAFSLPGAAPAGAGPAGADDQGSTVKKRVTCKRRWHRKRSCRKLRARLTWDDNAYIELHVWDSKLRHETSAGGNIPRAFVKQGRDNFQRFYIRRTRRFRRFAYGLCLVGPPAFEPTNFRIAFIERFNKKLVSHGSLFDRGQSRLFRDAGDPDPDPNVTGDWCQD